MEIAVCQACSAAYHRYVGKNGAGASNNVGAATAAKGKPAAGKRAGAGRGGGRGAGRGGGRGGK